MKQATYRIVHFPKVDKFIGIAWNYDEAVLISTRACESYTTARNSLDFECNSQRVELKWFDGEYTYDANSGQLIDAAGKLQGGIATERKG